MFIESQSLCNRTAVDKKKKMTKRKRKKFEPKLIAKNAQLMEHSDLQLNRNEIIKSLSKRLYTNVQIDIPLSYFDKHSHLNHSFNDNDY